MKKMIIDSYIMMTENNFTIWGGGLPPWVLNVLGANQGCIQLF